MGATKPRAVAYAGQERVTDMLQRAGGLMRGADPEHIHAIFKQAGIPAPPG